MDEIQNDEPTPGTLPESTPDASAETSADLAPEDPFRDASGEMPDPAAGAEGDNDFAAMLAQETEARKSEPKPGAKVTGTIVQIGEVDVFVDCGFRSELPIAAKELQDAEGKLTVQVGDTLTAHVQKGTDGLRLTRGVNARGGGMEILEQAHKDGTPVEGTVKETNKGGFSIDLGGKRAFCPFSQIELRRVDKPEIFVGRKLRFRILELSESGRNIVVSRRALLQEERDSKGKQTRQELTLGAVMEGTVTRLAPFGAFVDIGGVEGLVHISQISHRRIRQASEVLKEGEAVRVKILEIQNLGQGRQERISLSIKVLNDDPWPAAAGALQLGSEMPGRVTRLADFGAFVEIGGGIEGLVHISEITDHRIYHPQEALREGQEVSVRVLDVDLGRRRISLSIKQAMESAEGDAEQAEED